MDELAELRIRQRQTEIRNLRQRTALSRGLRIFALIALVVTALLALMLFALPAFADYRPQFAARSLNKTLVIEHGRARTLPGGDGTHYIFKETKRDYYRGPTSCIVQYRRNGRERHDLRRTHHCPAKHR